MAGEKENVMYCHSKCCGAHWELVVRDGTDWDLECEQCGESVGDQVYVEGPDMTECTCDECKKEQERQN